MEWSTSYEDDNLAWETVAAVGDDDSDEDPDDMDDCEHEDKKDTGQLECRGSHT